MNPVFEAAIEVQRFLQESGWRFCIIGGVALQRWGEPRATVDVDLTLLTGFGAEEGFIQGLLSHFKPRRPDAAEFALASRVMLLWASNEIGVDIALGGFSFEEDVVSRATPFLFAPGVSLVTCSAEDLVVLKAFAGRPQDWIDVEGILVRQGEGLDWGYILRQLPPLCELKEDPEVLPRLQKLRQRASEF
jgi:hypothetical protein